MLRKKKYNSDYEIDRELTGMFAIKMNAEYQEEIAELKEENKKLNGRIANLKEEVEDNHKIIEHYKNEKKLMKTQIKKLKDELSKYKKQYQHSMGFMEEDTPQELKDIGELGDDELIYEEGLYD